MTADVQPPIRFVRFEDVIQETALSERPSATGSKPENSRTRAARRRAESIARKAERRALKEGKRKSSFALVGLFGAANKLNG